MDQFVIFNKGPQFFSLHLAAAFVLALSLGVCAYAFTCSPSSPSDAPSSEQRIIDLHEEHGSVVCVKSQWYSVSDPKVAAVLLTTFASASKNWGLKWTSAIDVHLFGPHSKLHMSVQMSKTEGLDGQDSQKSPYNQYQAHIDSCIALFHAKLSECSEPVNLSHWINCLVWDTMSAVTIGEPFGFLSRDDEGLHSLIQNLEKWNATTTWRDVPAAFMRRLAFLVGYLPTDPDYLESFVIAQLKQRLEYGTDLDSADVCDVLAKFVSKAATDSLYSIVIACAANIVASSSATAVGIKSALFHVYTNRRVLETLRKELRAKEKENQLSDVIALRQAEKLQYLQAVIKEAVRLHTISGLPTHLIEASEETLEEHQIPRGSKISVSASAIYRNKATFGDDAATFRPERWLAVTEERLEQMELYLRHFGGDTFDLNLVGMLKIIPQIVRRFDFELEPGVSQGDFWAVGFQNFICKVKVCDSTPPQHRNRSSRNHRERHHQRYGHGHGHGQGSGSRQKQSRTNQENRSTRNTQDASRAAVYQSYQDAWKKTEHPPTAAASLNAWKSLPSQLAKNEAAVAAIRREQLAAGTQENIQPPAIKETFKHRTEDGVATTTKAVEPGKTVHQDNQNDE